MMQQKERSVSVGPATVVGTSFSFLFHVLLQDNKGEKLGNVDGQMIKVKEVSRPKVFVKLLAKDY